MENLFLYSHQALAGYSLLQASSIYGESRIGWMTRDVHRITLLFMALNGAAFAYQASKLNTPSLATKTLALIPSTLAGLIYYLKGVQPQKGDPVEFDIENLVDQFDRKVDLQGTYTINKKDFPNSQVILQALILALSIQSAISLFFETNSPWNYLQFAGMGAALHQARQMDWIGVHHQSPRTLEFSYQYPSAHKDLQPKITYYALLPTINGGNENCTICTSEQTDSYYCSNKHRYCKECLEGVFVTKIKELATQLFDEDRYGVVFQFTKPQYGATYHSGTKFTFYFKENEAPRCPTCRESPGHAYLSFKQGDVKIVNQETNAKSSFWARCFLIYSAAQLALATFQYVDPKIAPSLYQIQTYALPLDALLTGAFFVSEAKMFNAEPEKNKTMKIAAGIALLGIALFAFYRWQSIKTDLAPLLKSTLPENVLKGIKISDAPPMLHRALEAMYGARFLMVLAAMSFSTNQKILALTALVNALTLIKMVKLPWICFQRTYDVAFSRYANTATPHFYVMLPNAKQLFPGKNPLSQAVHALYDFTTDFFKDSSWYGYWKTTRTNGVVTSRTLNFDAKILPQEWMIGGLNFFDFVRHWGGTAFCSFDGTGTLNIKIKS